MQETVVYSTDNKDKTNSLTILDYLASEGWLTGKDLETAQDIVKAFRKQKSLSTSFNYERLFVDGGKQDPQWEIIIQANRKWSEYEQQLGNKAKLIEKYLCIEKTVGQLKQELRMNFYDVIGEIIMTIQQLTRRLCSDWELMIIELNKQVKTYGFRKTCRQAKINFKTLQKILNGSKKINVSSLEKLLKFFNIDVITR